VEEVVVPQEETTEEEQAEETQDVLTLTGEDKEAYESYLAKKAKREPYIKPKSPQPKKTYDVTAEKLERIELRQDGYSKEEVEAIMDLGGSKSLNNPLVKTAIEAMRNKQKSEDANIAPSSKSPVFKKFTQSDLNNMSSAELAKILPTD
jgi:hypothetical protein